MKQRQEVLNVTLAQLLMDRGADADAEQIMYRAGNRHMPDVIVQFQGLRLAIEGEYEAAGAQDKALKSAKNRVETGIAHLGIGVVYPADLKAVPQRELAARM